MRTVARALPALCLLIAWWGAAPPSTDAQDRTKRGTVPLSPSGTVVVDNHEGAITLRTRFGLRTAPTIPRPPW